MPIYGDPQTWPPTPKKSTFRAAIEQIYAHSGRVNNHRFFLTGSTAISLQEQGTTPYCRTNSCDLRVIQFKPPAGFFYWQLACKAPHLFHTFRVFCPRYLSHFLRTSKDESPSHECSRSHRTARHSVSSMSVESPSQGWRI